MCQRIVFCFFILIGVTVNAQDIDIYGKVSNQAGQAVEGAIVELVKAGIKDTTKADGLYALANGTGTIVQSLLPQTERIALVRGVLKLSLNKPSPVKIQLFDVKGNLLKKEVYSSRPAGYRYLNIAEYSRASKPLVVHASVGKQKKNIPLPSAA
ncbi:MAG: hypothetical protein JW913_03580 [Chitinispirillaceae bacterium]|nr:hypothetical protein [Chitinispirillaceae bacterium]